MTLSAVKGIRCSGWSDFSRRVDRELGEVFIGTGRYVFRGHSNSRHRLVSYFDRMFSGMGDEQRRRVHSRLGDLFRVTAEYNRIDLPTAEHDLWALAQHYGLATRMLDWSESRYVAAFFAFSALRREFPTALDVENDKNGRNVAVYALDTASPVWASDGGVRVVRSGSLGENERLRRQRGVFTVNYSDVRSVEEFAKRYISRNREEVDRSPIYRFDLPMKEARRALRDLHEMRISHAELFPGLDGIAQESMLREWLSS